MPLLVPTRLEHAMAFFLLMGTAIAHDEWVLGVPVLRARNRKAVRAVGKKSIVLLGFFEDLDQEVPVVPISDVFSTRAHAPAHTHAKAPENRDKRYMSHFPLVRASFACAVKRDRNRHSRSTAEQTIR